MTAVLPQLAVLCVNLRRLTGFLQQYAAENARTVTFQV